jgi:Uma2 family endonuclease
MHLTIEDFERIQTLFTENQLDYQLELEDGKIIIMGLSDYLSEEVIARLITLLSNWVNPQRLGRVTGSGAGFRLPNPTNDLKGPDVSFVSAKRMRRSPRDFAQIVPDLMVEVKSKSDRIKPLEDKIMQFLALGTYVGMLVDPDKQTATIYYSDDRTPVVLGNGDVIELPDLLPGLSIPVSELWPPVF